MKIDIHPDLDRIKAHGLYPQIRMHAEAVPGSDGSGPLHASGWLEPNISMMKRCGCIPSIHPGTWHEEAMKELLRFQKATIECHDALGIERGVEIEIWIRPDGLWVRMPGSDTILHVPHDGMTGHEVLELHETIQADEAFSCQNLRRYADPAMEGGDPDAALVDLDSFIELLDAQIGRSHPNPLVRMAGAIRRAARWTFGLMRRRMGG